MRNKTIAALLTVMYFVDAQADDMQDTLAQMLDTQIQQLESERDAKYAELQQCETTTKNFKIAGSITIAMTTAGIATNVTLAAQRANLAAGGAGGGRGKTPTDTRPQEQKDCSGAQTLCDAGVTEFCGKC